MDSSVRIKSPWLILAVSLIGTFIGTLGNSMANIAVPGIVAEMNIPLTSGVWVVTLYTVVFAVLMPASGDLGRRMGQRRLYMSGIALVAAASLAASLARSFPVLLAARVVQGIGIAPILPAIMVMIARSFPASQRGRAMGYWALVNSGGHAVGPVISGLLIQYLGWRTSFFFLFPFSLVCFLLVWRVVPDDRPETNEHFDLKGAVSLTFASLGLMLSLTQSVKLGWLSMPSILFWVITLLGLAAFLYFETHTKLPLVELKMFAKPAYRAAIVVIAVESFILFGLLISIPVLFIKGQGWLSQTVGLITMTLTGVMALLGPTAGKISDHRGSRLTCTTGMILVFASTAVLFLTQPPSGLLNTIPVFVGLFVIGTGLGMVQSPVTAAVIHVVNPEKVGVATGIFHMVRFIAGALGSTVFGIILETSRVGITAGFYQGLLLIAVVAVLAAGFSLRLPAANRLAVPERQGSPLP